MRKGLRVAGLMAAVSVLAVAAGVRIGHGTPVTRERPKPAVITTAEAKHIIAYYRAARKTLYVYNQRALATGIERGVYKLKWTPGARQATLSLPRVNASSRTAIVPIQIIVAVVYQATSSGLVNTAPALGDTKMVEYAKKYDFAESVGPCVPSAPGSVVLNIKASKEVERAYTYLADDGDQSGQETYSAVSRTDLYALKDCSRGYLQSVDDLSAFVLSVQAWPNP